MNEFTPWHNEALGKKVVESLKKNGFEAEYCPSAAEAAEQKRKPAAQTAYTAEERQPREL